MKLAWRFMIEKDNADSNTKGKHCMIIFNNLEQRQSKRKDLNYGNL